MVEIGDDDVVEVERLILPWTVHGQSTYHPCIKPFFAEMADTVEAASPSTPRRLYVARTRAQNRRLSNEAELIEALARVGFASVTLETLSLAEQIRLVRGADIIVAPHGAGLANIVFASPGAVVVELLMDSYVNWCFRHLAAVLGLRYDCVIGRARRPWGASGSVHGDAWIVSVPHVVACVHTMCSAQP